MPPLFQRVGTLAPSFVLWEGTRLVAAILLIGLPTLAMGYAFGSLLRIAGGDGEHAGGNVARLYTANVVGAIVAVPLTTFVLAPRLGSQLAFVLIAVGEVCLGGVALVGSADARRKRLLVAGAFAVLCVTSLLMGSRWNMAVLLSGSNVYFSEGFAQYDALRYLKEDRAGGIVAVVERDKVKTLLANGKFEGNDGFEVPDQEMFALFPLLFVRSHGFAANIGIGTANTLAVIGNFPFSHIDAVDISSAVVDAARVEFSGLNHHIFDDPRVSVHIDDGRNFLLRNRTRYDLVTVQLSSVWIGGTAELYNVEFYEAVRDRLTVGGVFQQWVQLHHIQTKDVARIVATAQEVFPHVTLWVAGHQGVVVGSMSELRADAAALRTWSATPRLRETLKAAGLEHPFEAFGHLYMDDKGLSAFTEEVALTEGMSHADLISRDDTATLEYSTPRGNLLTDAVGDNMQILRRHSDPDVARHVDNLEDDTERRLLLAYAARARGFARLADIILAPVASRISREAHAGLFRAIEDGRAHHAVLP
jgi:spermidine synthase